MKKKLFNPCTECKEAEGMWHIRARTKFVCEECHKEVEWRGHEDFSKRKGVQIEQK